MSKTKIAHFFIPHHKNNYRAHFLKPIAFHTVIILLLLLQLSFSLMRSVHPQVLGVSYSITPEDIIAQTNDQRGKNGLATLQRNDKLAAAAQLKGQDMLAKGYWAHVSPDGKEPWFFINQAGYNYSRAGENLARDFRDSISVVNAWMNSPGHRANLLNTHYKDIGVAVVSGPFNGYEAVIVVQMFGEPASGGSGNIANSLQAVPQVAAQQSAAQGKELALKFEKEPEATTASTAANTSVLTKPDNIQLQPIPETTAPILDQQSIMRIVVLTAGLFFTTLLLIDAIIVAKQRVHRPHHGHSFVHAVFLIVVMISLLIVQSGMIL